MLIIWKKKGGGINAPSPEGRSRAVREMIGRTYCINIGDLSVTQGIRRIKD